MDIDNKSIELRKAKTPYCLATVVKVTGSAPRHAGAKMIVTASESFGTVGGGGVEHQAIDDARKILRRRSPELKKYDLTEQGIQPCGGEVEIFLEPIVPPKRIVVFGAGHVAEKLCPMLAEANFEVTLVDEREDRLAADAFKDVPHKINKLPGDFLPSLDFADDLHIICITHRHVHDEAIVRYCLKKPSRYLGVISSRSKWKLFSEKYKAEGFTDEQISHVSVPIGLDIGAETPFEIAVAIVAQLIQLHEKPDDFETGRCHFKL